VCLKAALLSHVCLDRDRVHGNERGAAGPTDDNVNNRNARDTSKRKDQKKQQQFTVPTEISSTSRASQRYDSSVLPSFESVHAEQGSLTML
jgi:hypothetical protein